MAAVSDTLSSTLADSSHSFLQPSLALYTETLAYLKHTLDPLATDVSSTQQQRQRDLRRKRKRGQQNANDDVLRIKQIHTAGFSVDQVWEQARRVIDAARGEAERGLEAAKTRVASFSDEPQRQETDLSEDDLESDSLGEEGVDYVVEGSDIEEEDWDEENGMEELEGVDALSGDEHIEMDEEDLDEDAQRNDEPPEEFVEDKFGLNDGFFSIDAFNRTSEFLEQQDARGEDDGGGSDEEDVDWDADPLGQASAQGAGSAPADDGRGDEDEDEEGPTFGDPDAPSEDEHEELDGGDMDVMNDMANTNHIMYADFFAAPAQQKRRNKKGRPNPHNFPEVSVNDNVAIDKVQDDDLEQTMAAVHRELFEDEESVQEDEDDQEQTDPSDPKSRRSTHERRKAALAEEIRKLEAANVAKREWTLSGEARAAERPVNSLLEEDLDFERTGKPVPVITAEVSESIEELIKRRILAQEFQDIIRRRPDDLATGKRGRLDFQLDDSKSKKGLAEEYEEEHLRRTDPNFVDVKDEKLKKEEKEIETLWKKVCGDLDSLSSWHFRPKQPAPQLDIRVDAPVIGIEDARPSASGDVAGASQLAPQEVYRAGEAANGVREEVIGKSGLPAGREEMGRDEKKRRRRREKERIRKAGANQGAKKESKGAEERRQVVSDLKRGNVKVVGKDGVTDVEGRGVNASSGSALQGAGRYKL